MNHIVPQPKTTQAAEGLPRRPLTTHDLQRMVEIGIIGHDERVELIGGEIVPMSAKGAQHEILKIALNRYWSKRAPDNVTVAQETGLYLSDETYLEPDFVFYPRSVRWDALNGANLLLVVEIADSSLRYDQGRKAELYASFGVRELWVIDAVKLTVIVHRDPQPKGYQTTEEFDRAAAVTPLELSSLGVTLAALELL